MRVCGFFLLTSSSTRKMNSRIPNDKPPRGGRLAPDFGPSFGGPARPSALRIPPPTSGAGPPRRCLRHRGRGLCGRSVRPAGANTGLTGRASGAMWGWCSAPRGGPSRRLVGCGKHLDEAGGTGSAWPRLCRLRLRCASCGPRSRPTAPLPAGRHEGRGAAAGRPGRSGEG